jgi:PAS domain S-box-containing protein
MIPKLYSLSALPDPLDLFGQLLAQAPFAVWVADRSGRVILFNEAMRNLVGIEDPEKILGNYNIFEDPIATSQGLVPYIKRVLQGQVVQTVVMMDLSQESFGNGHNPKVFYVRCVYFPVRDHSGNFEYIVTLVENITQQYLVDIALSKAVHEVDSANKDLLDREKLMVAHKNRIKRLTKQLAGLKKTV